MGNFQCPEKLEGECFTRKYNTYEHGVVLADAPVSNESRNNADNNNNNKLMVRAYL